MTSSVCILLYGADPILVETRGLVLARAGFQVKIALRLSDAENILVAQPNALLILCHSLSIEECEKALRMARSRRPTMKCLVLTAGTSLSESARDAQLLSSFDGPRELIATIDRLVESYRD